MKAPDKIYIPIIEEDGKKLLCTNWLETDTSSRNAYVKETIPYISKEALMEWAKEHQEGERQGSYTWSCYQIFIDKLNEM